MNTLFETRRVRIRLIPLLSSMLIVQSVFAGDIEQILPPASNFTIDGDGGGEVARVQSDGLVGIGTITPHEKLEVNGHIRMTDGNEAANTVMIGDAAGTATWADISTVQDGTGTDDQNLQDFNLSGTTLNLTIENGNTVNVDLTSLSGTGTDDQNLTLSGNILSIENGNSVDLSAYLDNTDDQQITDFNLSGTDLTLTLEDGGTKTISLASLDNNGTDDQALSLDAATNILTLEDGGTVDLSAYLDNTDDQNLSLVGSTLSIENGNSVDLSDFNDSVAIGTVAATLITHIAADLDTNATNEIQDISTDNTAGNIALSDGSTLTLNVDDADADSTNEIQTLTSTDGSVTLTQTGNDYDLSIPAQTVTTIANTIVGHKIADYTNESATTVNINETVTTLIQQVSPNQLDYQYTNEDATTTTVRSSPIVAFGKVKADGSLLRGYGATVVRDSKGKYKVTLDNSRSSADYIIQLTILDSNGAGNDDYDISYSNQASGSFVVQTGDNDNGGGDRAQRDSEFMFTVIDY